MLANIKARAELAPLVRNEFTVPGSEMRFTAACFGGEDKEWSLKPLQGPGDVAANLVLAHKIRSAIRHLDADRIYAPSPVEFNGKIIQPGGLTNVLMLGNGVLLFRNAKVPADGTFLRTERDAGIFSAGGCGLIAAVLDGHMIFAHAGRDCVINRKRVLGEGNARPFESVVDSIVEAFFALGYAEDDLHRMHAWPLYSIRPEDFIHRYDDPRHANYNLIVSPYLARRNLDLGAHLVPGGVELDIPAIIKLQFMQRGVPWKNIHMEHAYLADELPTTRNGGGRYLVAIVRH